MAPERDLFGSPTYNCALIQAVKDAHVTWKAWARIQSAQCLTACLILADAYSSQMLSVMPILSPDEVQIPLIRGDDLFMDPWNAPLFMAFDTQNYLRGLAGFGLQTVLTVTWLRILKSQRSIQNPTDSMPELWTPHPSLHSGHTDTNSASFIVTCLPLIFNTYEASFKTGNGNSLILWHYLGLCLTTNLSVVEDAAGRNGPGAAKRAAETLNLWAKSPAARRACLHTIQVLLALTHHCQSDGVMLHSEMALFNAALVLGQATLHAMTFDDVDWAEVGASGLDVHTLQEDASSSISAAAVFIRDGGRVCFRGAEYHSPYGAARRSFMDFASQLEEIGKWNVQEYCKVLHIINDTLFASDNMNGA
ncbi:hypothetical protein BDW59DRAFT_173438 [Aspergillus cavernicola]|uniref:Transcription factor domain-containing protein n=1 Tax=Aspergillus cavernicola TaxID=176166 RepID=A0ABR4I8Y8_9EURO